MRSRGEYYNLSSLVERVAPGKLVDEVIKIQHNCVSDSRHYKGNLIRIAHEKLLIFRKLKASLFLLGTMERRAGAMVSITWRSAVRRVLQGGKTLHLKEINAAIEPFARTRQNQHWEAKVRQILQDQRYFTRIEQGVYTLAS
jgi:hypothetical protein